MNFSSVYEGKSRLFSVVASWLRLGMVVLAAGLLAGCDEEPVLGRVQGRVTLDGVPLAQASVMFLPMAGGRPATAVTDADGHFELNFVGTRKGAVIGRHEVQISTFVPAQQSVDDTGEQIVLTPERRERLPRRYHKRTELSADVVPGESTFDFDLRSDPGDPPSAASTRVTGADADVAGAQERRATGN